MTVQIKGELESPTNGDRDAQIVRAKQALDGFDPRPEVTFAIDRASGRVRLGGPRWAVLLLVLQID